MHDHTGFKERIDEVLVRLADEEEQALLGLHVELSPLSEQLRRSLARGKRIRAAFLYWGWRAAGQPDCEGVIRAAAAMELVHAAACTHDDIIDDSRMRHGQLTAHAAFAAAGQRSTALAMILGDLLMGYAGHVFTSCGLPGAYLARTVPLWSTLLRETMAGEFLEVLRTDARAAREPQVAESLEVARYKTAKYTVERPLHLGATLGGGSRALLDAFSAYGLPLGEAFQLRDDLLGTFGDPATTGKSNLDDLRDAKPTALLALTMAAADPDDLRLLAKLVGNPELGTEEAASVRELMERCGARQQVEDMIRERIVRATGALDTVPMPGEARSALHDLAGTAAERSL
ncbi:polyprenyl synthetase family protein [Streptomyces sp. ISL-44]|uniref:polyprenyl synthetase family protein n=1 Tax=unclassified Streptomyces TaxID=2593676 RepID=UPI001BEAC590|nr:MULTISPECIES: polyprenyl synthetase family protein [unclassified Streptomyces]MBT2541138.1 polyprenyl synthetase family protein [Streptomyces sp. ISL-44]MCX5010568.1 polyprenyl synthetase family protein [Streptomyces sp. NBC_00555]MCX5611000.1 polyprenyl synthetase family protein [Streptomyces sp. NBC_00047]UUU38893.1 polyprenyl synthetase family protein [Streptomyces sp. NBC_00162]